jgi:hypothetical protein
MKKGTIHTDESCMIAVSSRLKKSCESGQKNRMNNAVQIIPIGDSVDLAMRPMRYTNKVNNMADNGLMSSGCQIYPPVLGKSDKAVSIDINTKRYVTRIFML